jgi:serine/threonine-protein kinase
MFDFGHIGPGAIVCGRYRVDRLLKAGGMGAVFVAEHTTTRKKVALKLMRPEIVASESSRARFAQEAQASGIIESANVVDVYDAGVDPETNVPFIVMELLSGVELGELVDQRGGLLPAEVVDYLGQTARALDRAHAAGIIHRDLKPDNLFLTLREGEPPRIKILDFGIAKFLASAGAETTRAAGTPLYMAPEQTRKGSPVGPATDVWALGLIAYTLLVGRPYWEGEDMHEIFGEILSGAREAPSARAARAGGSLPPGFDAWFLRCIAQDPAGRFGRAREAAVALADALGVPLGGPASASFPNLGERSLQGREASALTPTSGRALSTMEEASTIGDVSVPIAMVGGTPPYPQAQPAPSGTGRVLVPAPTGGSLVGSAVSDTAAPAPPPPRRGRAFAVVAAIGLLAGGGLGAALVLRARHAAGTGKAAVSLALGLSDATCVLDADGSARCVGMRFGDKQGGPAPYPLELPGPAAALAIGKHHACARLLNTTVVCWGRNDVGQLGDGTERDHGPAAIPGLHNVEQVALNIHGGCVRQDQGRVKCWGANKYGQVGDGTTTARLAPVEVEGAQGALSIALGQDHGCAVFGDGTVRCWGRNADGELGTGDRSDHSVPTPVTGLQGAVAVALGGHFSCAMTHDGAVWCWGSNGDGELGTGGAEPSRPTPAQVVGLDGVRQISAGWRHACARSKAVGIRCWGQNSFGQVGDGTTTNRPIPIPVPGSFTQIAAGRMHTCGLRKEGGVACWGRNDEGQLGDATKQNRLEPAIVTW